MTKVAIFVPPKKVEQGRKETHSCILVCVNDINALFIPIMCLQNDSSSANERFTQLEEEVECY